MKKINEPKERQRREYAPAGERNQKMICFRCDNENLEWLNQQPNKGRAINRLIAEERERGAN